MSWEIYLEFASELLWEIRVQLLLGAMLYLIILVVLPWLKRRKNIKTRSG